MKVEKDQTPNKPTKNKVVSSASKTMIIPKEAIKFNKLQ
jgi:hypothetical protein